MDTLFLLNSAGQLVLSAVFASLVGYEREMHGRPAGLRTHILVGLGATLFTLASISMVRYGVSGSADRIAAQVVSGIGFLGAGTIIRQGSVVRGLTTAASLWAVAGLGVAIGIGGRFIGVATVAAAVIVITLTVLPHVERWLEGRRRYREVTITVTDPKGVLHSIVHLLDELGVEVRQTNLTAGISAGVSAFAVRLFKEEGMDVARITGRLSDLPQVIAVEWD